MGGGGGDASRGEKAHSISEPLVRYLERVHWDRDTSLHLSNVAKSLQDYELTISITKHRSIFLGIVRQPRDRLILPVPVQFGITTPQDQGRVYPDADAKDP